MNCSLLAGGGGGRGEGVQEKEYRRRSSTGRGKGGGGGDAAGGGGGGVQEECRRIVSLPSLEIVMETLLAVIGDILYLESA